jgi:hypothetical protein
MQIHYEIVNYRPPLFLRDVVFSHIIYLLDVSEGHVQYFDKHAHVVLKDRRHDKRH